MSRGQTASTYFKFTVVKQVLPILIPCLYVILDDLNLYQLTINRVLIIVPPHIVPPYD